MQETGPARASTEHHDAQHVHHHFPHEDPIHRNNINYHEHRSTSIEQYNAMYSGLKIKVQNKLLNETGNIILERITDERRRKVQEEDLQIQEKVRKQNIQSVRNFYREENRKLRMRDAFRIAMEDRWKKKLANSPYAIDQYEYDLKRQEKTQKILQARQFEAFRKDLIDSMSGKYVDKWIDPADTKHFDTDAKLAYRLQKEILDGKTVQGEQLLLSQFREEELNRIQSTFPQLVSNLTSSTTAAALEGTSTLTTDHSSTLPSSSTFLPKKSPGSPYQQRLPRIRESPNVRSKFKYNPKDSIQSSSSGKKSKKLSAESSSTSLESGVLHSPVQRMKQISDDISTEFAMLQT